MNRDCTRWSNLLNGSPCRCNPCRQVKRDELLEKLIRAVDTPLRKRGKRLIVRTHNASLEETHTVCAAVNRFPKDLPVTVMSKAIQSDFFGFQYPDDRTFTLIRDRPLDFVLDKPFQMLEFLGSRIVLRTFEGHDICWPISKSVTGPKLMAGSRYRVSLRNEGESVVVVADLAKEPSWDAKGRSVEEVEGKQAAPN